MGKGDNVTKKYTPFKRAKDYAPSKKSVDQISKNMFGKNYKDVGPTGQGGKTDV